MAGGKTQTTQDYQPNFQFNPSSSGGGMIEIGGNVAMGNTEFGGSSTATGAKTDFGLDLKFGKLMLMNLANEIEHVNVEGTANFAGKNGGKNQIGNVNGRKGSTLNFGLVNLANSHIKSFDGYGRVDFQGGGAGKHTIDDVRANQGSHFVFSI